MQTLSWPERARQAVQATVLMWREHCQPWLARLGLSRAEQIYLAQELPDPPTSPLCRTATEICRLHCPAELAAHCFRSYYWGALLSARDGLRFDPETLWVAAALHDVGLTALAFPDGQEQVCFACSGGRWAADFCRSHGEPERRAGLVEQAIALHLNVSVPSAQGVEAHLLNAGTAMDTLGIRARHLARGTRQLVLARHPRSSDFRELFGALVEEQARQFPGTRAHFLCRYLFFSHQLRPSL